MDAALVVLAIVVATAALGGAMLARRRARTPGAPDLPARDDGSRSRDGIVLDVSPGEIVLDVTADDPDQPAVVRLVSEIAEAALRDDPSIDEVTVRGSDGAVLGRRRRPEPLAPTTPGPGRQPGPARRRVHRPSPVPREDTSRPPVGEAPDRPGRSFADRFELPAAVTAELTDADDPVELVRALLVAAGRPADVRGELVRTGDHLIAVVGSPRSRPVSPEVMSELYLRFRRSGATTGTIISLETQNWEDVRRRELLAPELSHTTTRALQRMADAVALGTDPLALLSGPAGATSGAPDA